MPLTAAPLPKKGNTLGGLPFCFKGGGAGVIMISFIDFFFLSDEIELMTGIPRPLRPGVRLLTRSRVVGTAVVETTWPPAPVNSPGSLEQIILHQALHTFVRFNSLVVLFWIMRLDAD